jgi:hypothetical protein
LVLSGVKTFEIEKEYEKDSDSQAFASKREWS